MVGADTEYQSVAAAVVHDVKYRAWGDLKHVESTASNNNQFSWSFQYGGDLKLSNYEHRINGNWGLGLEFRRFADGNLQFAENNILTSGDRSYRYDHVGRLTKGYSGKDAHDGDTNVMVGPYKHDFTYNSFSDITQMTGKQWGQNVGIGYLKSYDANGRDALTGYDAAGNIISDRIRTIWPQPILDRTMKYDAAGRQVETFDPAVHPCCEVDTTYSTSFDGNGWKVANRTHSSATDHTSYEIRSTVLAGEIVTTIGYPLTKFIAPVLGGEIGHTDVGYGPVFGFTREAPEGFNYDTRGAEVTEEPVDGGGSYPAGGVDPSVYTRCSVEGGPTSCETQARMNRAFEEIGRRIDKVREEEAPKSGRGTSMAMESRRTDRTGQLTMGAIKPYASFGIGEMLEISSLPPMSSDKDDNEEEPIRIYTLEFVPGRQVDDGFNLPIRDRSPVPVQDTDCDFLINFISSLVQKHAKDWTNVAFVRGIQTELIDNNNPHSSDAAVRERYNEHGSSGFKSAFHDADSPNQVRHFAGGLVNAYYAGLAAYTAAPPFTARQAEVAANKIALETANKRENGSVGDIALNGVAVPLGVGLGFGSIKRANLPQLIRSQICE